MQFSQKVVTFLSLGAFLFGNCAPKKKKEPLEDPIVLLGLAKVIEDSKPKSCDQGKVDTYFSKQWHLENKGNLDASAVAGEDARVKNVWNMGNRGDEIVIAVLDDGLDEKHEDLKPALSSIKGLSYSYTNPYLTAQHASPNSAHGTAVAGVAAGRGGNGIGISGAAPCAQITGRGILEVNATDDQVAEATIKDIDRIHVSNNSWGAADYTGQLFPSSTIWQAAIEEGLSFGRGGKGSIYLWAAGNGGRPSPSITTEIDNSNYDGQANFYGVLAICGVGINGKRAFYSERGANLWVCAHTQGDNGTQTTTAITTTDPTGEAGSNDSTTANSQDMSDINYTQNFNGTSSATPLAAGVVALVLKANPNLGWRDVREILAKSARKNDPTNSDWTQNAAGYNINHNYGFGTVDAESAVNLAKNWTLITEQLKKESTGSSSTVSIPDNNLTGISTSVSYSGSISKIEFVDVEVTSNHAYHGDLTFTLTAPSGTKSILSEKHVCLDQNLNQVTCNGFTGSQTYRFGTARHLGENPNGTWTLKAVDGAAGDTGSFSFKLKIYGR